MSYLIIKYSWIWILTVQVIITNNQAKTRLPGITYLPRIPSRSHLRNGNYERTIFSVSLPRVWDPYVCSVSILTIAEARKHRPAMVMQIFQMDARRRQPSPIDYYYCLLHYWLPDSCANNWRLVVYFATYSLLLPDVMFYGKLYTAIYILCNRNIINNILNFNTVYSRSRV